MAYVNQLKELQLLHLNRTKITDKNLELLTPLEKLEWLDLNNTGISQGLAHLRVVVVLGQRLHLHRSRDHELPGLVFLPLAQKAHRSVERRCARGVGLFWVSAAPSSIASRSGGALFHRLGLVFGECGYDRFRLS